MLHKSFLVIVQKKSCVQELPLVPRQSLVTVSTISHVISNTAASWLIDNMCSAVIHEATKMIVMWLEPVLKLFYQHRAPNSHGSLFQSINLILVPCIGNVLKVSWVQINFQCSKNKHQGEKTAICCKSLICRKSAVFLFKGTCLSIAPKPQFLKVKSPFYLNTHWIFSFFGACVSAIKKRKSWSRK